MSTTTAADLLDRAHALTRDLRRSEDTLTRGQWDAFDDTVHRLLTNLLGPHGRNIPHRSKRRNQLHAAALTYPQPVRDNTIAANLAPHSAKPTGLRLVPNAAARSHLPAANDHGQPMPTLPDLDLPSATDPHPLARLTCTLGALADLLVDASPWVVTSGRGDLADATTRVLSVAAVAGRHTLSVGNLDDADRVLAVGRWAERSMHLIGERSASTATLDRVGATLPDRASDGINDRLEAARVDWTHAAQAEVGMLIPSVDVLRVIANQGAHLYGLTAEIVRKDPDLAREAELLVPALAHAAQGVPGRRPGMGRAHHAHPPHPRVPLREPTAPQRPQSRCCAAQPGWNGRAGPQPDPERPGCPRDHHSRARSRNQHPAEPTAAIPPPLRHTRPLTRPPRASQPPNRQKNRSSRHPGRTRPPAAMVEGRDRRTGRRPPDGDSAPWTTGY